MGQMSRKSEQMKVYIADVEALADPLKYRAAYQQASEARKSKVDRFRFETDKRLSLGAGILLQQALERENISDWVIDVMPGGKPYLKNTREWFFNLSHSGTKVLCVLAREPVGCDIEKTEKAPLELVQGVLSRQEQNQLVCLEGDTQRDYFYKLWTGKESYLKLTGEGLSHRLNDITIFVPFRRQMIENKWVNFYDISCGEGYQATVCREGNLSSAQSTIHAEKLLAEYIEF